MNTLSLNMTALLIAIYVLITKCTQYIGHITAKDNDFVFNTDDYVISSDNTTWFVMQGDGNLLLYWETTTGYVNVCPVCPDGNYSSIWQSQTAGNPAAHAKLQKDGNLIVNRANGSQIFATNSTDSIGAKHLIISNQCAYILNTNMDLIWNTETAGCVDSQYPTFAPPTFEPTVEPTTEPTMQPTINPSANPSKSPTRNPSENPSQTPSPTNIPTGAPNEDGSVIYSTQVIQTTKKAEIIYVEKDDNTVMIAGIFSAVVVLLIVIIIVLIICMKKSKNNKDNYIDSKPEIIEMEKNEENDEKQANYGVISSEKQANIMLRTIPPVVNDNIVLSNLNTEGNNDVVMAMDYHNINIGEAEHDFGDGIDDIKNIENVQNDTVVDGDDKQTLGNIVDENIVTIGYKPEDKEDANDELLDDINTIQIE
eukprot:439614_1